MSNRSASAPQKTTAANKKQAFKEGNMDNTGKLNNPGQQPAVRKNTGDKKPAIGHNNNSTSRSRK